MRSSPICAMVSSADGRWPGDDQAKNSEERSQLGLLLFPR